MGNMRSNSGGELQVIHPLHLLGLFPVAIANLNLFLIERKPLQGKQWPADIHSHPLGLGSCLSPDAAANVKARAAPGENLLQSFWADKLLVDK